MASTLLVNAGLGWSKGKRIVWILHAVNAGLWIYYSLTIIHQNGMVGLSVVTMAVDIVSAWRTKNK
jgi:hypothetical protein